MLLQVALILFAFSAMLSLVIDIGFVRVTQGQMQTAADAAALEGVRKRDVGVVNPATGAAVNDPYASDCIRRASANRLVHWVFDDDFDAANGDPEYQFGAGPVLDSTEGATTLHGLQTISVPDTHVYKPDLQLNQQNQVYGDMVSGRFCYTSDPVRSEDASYEVQDLVCTEPQRGSGEYARNDFNPNLTAPQPPPGLQGCPTPDEAAPSPWPLGGTGSLDSVNDSAFLVRLRRSNEFRDFADQAEAAVASSGPALPLTFGKGAPIHGDDPSSTYSVRRDGLTVRATAIAAVRPAMHVGLPQANANQPGVTPFALADTFTPSANAAGTAVTINPGNGLICSGPTCTGAAPPNTIVGRFVDNLLDPTRARWLSISTVGQVLPPALPVACGLANTFAGYGPVYSSMAGGTTRVIGFSRIVFRPDPGRPGNPCARVISRGASLVAASNATTSVPGGLPLPVTSQPALVRELLDKNRVRTGRINYAPLLAPVLAR